MFPNCDGNRFNAKLSASPLRHDEAVAFKLVANQAAARATKACHQAHGAMSMTQEYPLHHLSRRLWSWRKEYGADAHWSALLCKMATGDGAEGLYPLITSGTAALQ